MFILCSTEHSSSTDDDEKADLKQDSVFVVSSNVDLDDGVYLDVDSSNSISLKGQKRKDERKDSSFFSLQEKDTISSESDDERNSPYDGIDNLSYRF